MPRVNLYVREDDYEAYEAIVDKPRWLHRAIHDTPAQRLPLNVIRGPEKKKEPVKQAEKAPVIRAITTEGKPAERTQFVAPQPLQIKHTFPPSAASQLDVIKTPEQAKKIVDTPQFIDKKYSARKPGSKERHVDL